MTSSAHVFVDATAIPADRGGVGRYLEGVLPPLATMVEVTIAVQNRDATWMRGLVPHATIVTPGAAVASRPLRLLWEQWGLPRAARRSGATVIFSPHYTSPLFTTLPRVVTFHDATFFSHPQYHGRVKRLFFRAWTRLSLGRARMGIAPSAATRDELITRLGAAAEKMAVAPHGVDTTIFNPPSDSERAAAELLTETPHWIAFLGTLEPRKNVRGLVEALPTVLADPAVIERFPSLTLVLVGGRGWDNELDSVITSSPASSRIRRMGFVPDEALRGVLGSALVVAYPSRAEGFGLPVLEAMACGALVLTTRSLALPEVGGDVALYTEHDSASIARNLIDALLAPDRDARAARGIQRASEFTWERSARIHRDAFERTLRGAS